MGIQIEELGRAALEVRINGSLAKDDYQEFVPAAEERIRQHGKLHLLVRVDSFKGWSPAALWEDLKFDMHHYGDVDRLALVSPDESQEWIATISRPFTGAEVRFFPQKNLASARGWVVGSENTGAPSSL
ncbi:MAG: STAS/SEC14 domain-containing protein [bacterium]